MKRDVPRLSKHGTLTRASLIFVVQVLCLRIAEFKRRVIQDPNEKVRLIVKNTKYSDLSSVKLTYQLTR